MGHGLLSQDQFPASSKLELVLAAVKVQTILKPEVSPPLTMMMLFSATFHSILAVYL